MKTTLFLGGPSAESSRVQRWAMALERSGIFDLTSQWHIDCDRWSGRDAYLTREQQHDLACLHMAAIARAEITWILAPRSLAGGAMVEMGIAAAFAAHTPGRVLAVSGLGNARTVYSSMANYRDESDDACAAYVFRVARERRGEVASVD